MRGVSATGVILIHLIRWYLNVYELPTVFVYLSNILRFSVPFFFIISGYLCTLKNYSGKERDMEKIISSSQKTEQVIKYINIELNPYNYVLTHRVVEEASKFERLRELTDFIDKYDELYVSFRDLLASLSIGRRNYVHNVINSITFTDQELKKALLGDD